MSDSINFVKLWAVVAPLAALAGLALIHYRRKKPDNIQHPSTNVREVVNRIDPLAKKTSTRPAEAISVAEESAKLIQSDTNHIEQHESAKENSPAPEPLPESSSPFEEVLAPTIIEEVLAPTMIEEVLAPESIEESSKHHRGESEGRERPRVDSGFSTMAEIVTQIETPTVEVVLESSDEVNELATADDVDCKSGIDEGVVCENETIEEVVIAEVVTEPHCEVATIEEPTTHEASLEVVEINSAPAILGEYEVNENGVSSSSERSYEIIHDSELPEQSEVQSDSEPVTPEEPKEPSSGLTDITEVSVEPEFVSGVSGSANLALPKHLEFGQRIRTDSENRDWENWADSPTSKVKPVQKEIPSIGKASKSTEKKAKTDRTKATKKSKNLKDVLESTERDSTTPDSAKESIVSKTKKRRRNGKKNKKKANSSNASAQSPSSDSGTATDDNIERYMEISGFPPALVGALIGRSGKNIKTIQQQSKCKILVKDYPVDGGGQYISIEGTSKCILKAVKILNDRFPGVNFSRELVEENLSLSPAVPESVDATYEDFYNYDYAEHYTGPTNNAGQVELVRGVPVEVRVTSLGPYFNDVWLQPYTHPSHDKFYNFEARMCEFYNHDDTQSIIPPSQYLPFGSYAAALHHTTDELTGKEVGKWYRVQIYQYTDDYTAMVLYLDFGNYASVPTEMIRHLMDDFHPSVSTIPFQVVHAQLAEVDNPVNSVLGPIVYDVIRKAPQSSLFAEVVAYDESKDMKPIVKLMYTIAGQKVSLNECIIETANSIMNVKEVKVAACS